MDGLRRPRALGRGRRHAGPGALRHRALQARPTPCACGRWRPSTSTVDRRRSSVTWPGCSAPTRRSASSKLLARLAAYPELDGRPPRQRGRGRGRRPHRGAAGRGALPERRRVAWSRRRPSSRPSCSPTPSLDEAQRRAALIEAVERVCDARRSAAWLEMLEDYAGARPCRRRHLLSRRRRGPLSAPHPLLDDHRRASRRPSTTTGWRGSSRDRGRRSA